MPLMDSLLKLHRVDAQVRGLRSRLDSSERYLRQQQTQLDQLTGRLEELTTRRKQMQARISAFETEGGGLDERIEKFRGDLNNAANTKQYQAVLTEVETVKNRRKEIDDQTIQEMEGVESLAAEITQLETDVAERTTLRDAAQAQRDERAGEVSGRLTELEQERTDAAGAVPGEALRVFDNAADLHDGEAMASVEEVSRRHREYACGECHMHLPFELVANLMGTVNHAVQCTNCKRILFLEEETRGALAPK
ncbi:MAG: zinc ribbon domain-containing protein [Phycisphaerales bacterium]